MSKGIKIEWIDSITPEVIGVKVYRDDAEIADVGLGVLEYNDATPLPGVEYKYEVQAYTASAESVTEVLGVNIAYYEIAATEPLQTPTGIQLELIAVDLDIDLYVSANGSGTEDGLTEANAMGYADARSAISTMSAGEIMGFKRGEVYKHTTFLNIGVSGATGNPITFTAYGSGERPKIDSTDIYTGTWTSQGSNIWTSEASAYNETNPRLKINGNEVLGTKIQAELGNLIPDRVVFWNDDATDTIHLYSTTDPNLDEVMYMRGSRAVYAYEQDNLVFDGLEFIGGYYGALMLAGTNNVEVKNCKMGDMCASGVNITDYGTTTCSNITVHDNDMNSSFPFDYRGGTVDDSETTERGSSDGVKVGQCFGGSIYNNTFFDWGHTGVSLTAGSSGEVVNNFTVYDNTFSLSALRDYGGGFTIDRDSSGHEVYNNTMTGCKSNQVNGYNNHFHHNDVIDTRQTALYNYEEGFGVDMATYAGAVYDNIIEFNTIINAESGAIRLRTSGTRNSGHRIRNNVTENCGSKNNNITVELNYGTTGIYDVNFDDNNFYNATETLIYYDADTANYEDIAFLNASTKYGINANNVNEEPLAGAHPIISDFTINDSNKDRVYFSSNKTITATTITGFYLSDNLRKQITGITINAGQTTGHYFTVDSPFTYWDTYSIRYEGGSDIQDSSGQPVRDFWLYEVLNAIPQPAPSGTPYFVRTTGSDSANGLTHDTAFATVQAALDENATTIYWEAGDYGQAPFDVGYNGTEANPVVIQGYKTQTGGVPDPITSNYWSWGNYGTGTNVTLDTSELPTITGTTTTRRTSGATAIEPSNYIIIKNVQLSYYNRGFDITSKNHIVLDNIVTIYTGGDDSGVGASVYVVGGSGSDSDCHNKFLNMQIAQCAVVGIRLYGGGSLFDNINVNADSAFGAGYDTPDYYLSIYHGSNLVIKNCNVAEIGEDIGSSHGIGFKTGSTPHANCTEYNLITDCTSRNMQGGIELRHEDVAYCVTRNMYLYTLPEDGTILDTVATGIVVRDGSHHNYFENIILERQHRAIYFTDTTEQGDQTNGHSCIFKNVVVSNSNIFLATNGKTSVVQAYDNEFHNITVDSILDELYWSNGSIVIMDETNTLTNSIFSNCTCTIGVLSPDSFVQDSNNYYNNTFATPVESATITNITEHNPLFVDQPNGDFKLQDSSPLVDIGVNTDNYYDMDGIERDQDAYSIGAYQNNIIT